MTSFSNLPIELVSSIISYCNLSTLQDACHLLLLQRTNILFATTLSSQNTSLWKFLYTSKFISPTPHSLNENNYIIGNSAQIESTSENFKIKFIRKCKQEKKWKTGLPRREMSLEGHLDNVTSGMVLHHYSSSSGEPKLTKKSVISGDGEGVLIQWDIYTGKYTRRLLNLHPMEVLDVRMMKMEAPGSDQKLDVIMSTSGTNPNHSAAIFNYESSRIALSDYVDGSCVESLGEEVPVTHKMSNTITTEENPEEDEEENVRMMFCKYLPASNTYVTASKNTVYLWDLNPLLQHSITTARAPGHFANRLKYSIDIKDNISCFKAFTFANKQELLFVGTSSGMLIIIKPHAFSNKQSTVPDFEQITTRIFVTPIKGFGLTDVTSFSKTPLLVAAGYEGVKVFALEFHASATTTSLESSLSLKQVTMFNDHKRPIRCVDVSRDGRRIITGSADFTLRVYEADNSLFTRRHYHQVTTSNSSASEPLPAIWKCKFVLSHEALITCFRFDAEKIVSGSVDCITAIWDVHTGEAIAKLTGHLNRINDILLDDDMMVTTSSDATLRVFDFSDPSLNLTTSLPYPVNPSLLYKTPELVTPIDKLKPSCGQGKIPLVLVLTGAFSPIHRAHCKALDLAKQWIDEWYSDRFEVVGGYLSPAHDSYNKFGLLPYYYRIQMCELAAKNYEWMMVDKWEICAKDFCLPHEELMHLSQYLNATVSERLYQGRPIRCMYVCGSDTMLSLSMQHILKEPFGAVAMQRPGWALLSSTTATSSTTSEAVARSERLRFFKSNCADYVFIIGDTEIIEKHTNHKLSEEEKQQVQERYRLHESDTSSTSIRACIIRNDWKAIEEMTFKEIAEYIQKNKLFDSLE